MLKKKKKKKKSLACRFRCVKCKLDFQEREENFCRLKLEKKTEHLHSKNIPAVIFRRADVDRVCTMEALIRCKHPDPPAGGDDDVACFSETAWR